MNDRILNKNYYDNVVNLLKSNYPLYNKQGLESTIYCIDDKLLKFYKWFVVSDFSQNQLYNYLIFCRNKLALYAPSLEANIIGITLDGTISHSNTKSITYGLLMSKGESFYDIFWSNGNHIQKCLWAGNIGKILAHRHFSISPNLSKLKIANIKPQHYLSEILDILYSCSITDKLLPNLSNEIAHRYLNNFNHADSCLNDILNQPVHGDLNIKNIIIDRYKELQFIDPGPALLAGVGINSPHERPLEFWWDVVLLAKHFNEDGGLDVKNRFLTEYANSSNLTKDRLESLTFFWELYCYLLVVAVCCKRYSDFLVANNPFALFLKNIDKSLDQYIEWYFHSALNLLGLSKLFKPRTPINDNNFFAS
ncbi:MAG: hypothetical protein V2B20_24820 [Pseudomonadota bacterium]